jgi:hypothetical protein
MHPKIVCTLMLLAGLLPLGGVGGQEPVDRYGDERTFDPDGYYIPATEIVINQRRLEFFHIETLEYYYDGGLHYDRPRLLTPSVTVAIRNESGEVTGHECTLFVGDGENLRISCQGTPIGDLLLEAKFLDDRGRYWNLLEYQLEPKVVARGKLFVITPGLSEQPLEVELVYTGGD